MGTIYQNLIYGNQSFDLSLQNVIQAAKIANAHDFIMEMPDKYETLISERGGSLSGGQK
jgi:ABC-type multidrug transport system fused ATPase/permease subunit